MKLPITQAQLDAVVEVTPTVANLETRQTLIALADVMQMIIQLNAREEQALALTRGMACNELTSVHTTVMDRLLAMGIMLNQVTPTLNQDEVVRAVEGMQIILREVQEIEDEERAAEREDEDQDIFGQLYAAPTVAADDDDDCTACESPSDPCCRTVALGVTAPDREILTDIFEQVEAGLRNDPETLLTIVYLHHKLDAVLDGVLRGKDLTDKEVAILTAFFKDVLAEIVESEPEPESRFEMRADVARIRKALSAVLEREV